MPARQECRNGQLGWPAARRGVWDMVYDGKFVGSETQEPPVAIRTRVQFDRIGFHL
jgi:hypothetical protein